MIPKDKKIKSRVGRRSTAATQSQSPAKPDILNRIFQNLTRQENVEQFKAKKNDYEEQSFSLGKAIYLAANADLPYLRKRLRQGYVQFLIHFTNYKRILFICEY